VLVRRLFKLVRGVGLAVLVGAGVLVATFKAGYVLFDWTLTRVYRYVERRQHGSDDVAV
jgi:hypothetical protein